MFDCGTLYILYSGWIWTIYIVGWGVGVAHDSRVALDYTD